MGLARAYSLFAAIAWFVVAGWQLASSEERAAAIAAIAGLAFVAAYLLQERGHHQQMDSARQRAAEDEER